MTQKLIAQGAEAKIILSSSQREGEGFRGRDKKRNKITRAESRVGREAFVIKNRIKKSYRIPELDKKIRKQRTKAETKLLKKASEVINCPKPIETSSNDFDKIKMPFIEGKKLSVYLDKFTLAKQKEICKKIGEEIAKLHDENIIHGDLTTSNMILVEDEKSFALKNKRAIASVMGVQVGREGSAKLFSKIYFIDFGLGYFNGKIEDKAVDLHLLKQALEAKHFKNWEKLWKSVEEGYKNFQSRGNVRETARKVLERLVAVEKRGRYKK